MPPASTLANTRTRIRFAALAEVRDQPIWCEALRHLAKDHRYYEVVGDTLGFDCRVLLLEDGEGTVRGLQPCFFVEQDLAVAAPPKLRPLVQGLRRRFPRFLRQRILMAGCAAGEGHLTAPPEAIVQMQEALRSFARKTGARLIVWKDVPASYRDRLRVLREPPIDCTHVASMPATRLALDFESFEGYLADRLSHAMRKNLRRKFRAMATAPPLDLEVTNDLGDSVDEALALYEQVFQRSRLQFEHLTKAFLQQLAARMPDRVRFFLWRQEGRLVAFSLCLVHEGVIYDEYLGLDYRVALDLHLYFVTFRDIVTWALAQGLTSYHSTPLNYEPKLRLGFDLQPLDLYFALTSPLLNRIARPLLARMSPTRGEPALSRFTNAREMDPFA